jgi:lipoprotein-anchoring transpeptidase ErfK/SrfK
MLRRVFLALAFALLASPAYAGSLRVVVDISSQTMNFLLDGSPGYSFDVSTGRKGFRTPTGTYRVQRMYQSYFSRKYENAPMPWSVFFKGGFAIHGTTDVKHLGRPVSHGCVRLHPDDAELLYGLIGAYGTAHTIIEVRA